MNWRQTFIMGIAASLLSSLTGLVYKEIYTQSFMVDFSMVIGTANVIAASTVGCMLMVVCYKLFVTWKGAKTLGWLNIAFGIISFASIVGVLGFNLPLEVEFPEMFPGLAIPMHFFPLTSLLTIVPFFKIDNHV